MKKLVLSLCLAVSLFAKDYFSPDNISLADVEYMYDYSVNKCVAQKFDDKTFQVTQIRKGDFYINDVVVNDPGRWYLIQFEWKNGIKEIELFSSYGECKMYEYVVVKRNDNIEQKAFVNLKPGSEPVNYIKK